MKTLTRDLIREKLEKLEQAQDLIMEAKDLIEEALLPSQKAHFEAYGKYGIDQLLGNGNPYDQGIQNLMEELYEEREELEDMEEANYQECCDANAKQ